jgi:hypothetical protein
MKPIRTAVAVAAIALGAATSFAANAATSARLAGEPASTDSADRTVYIDPNTRVVNVTHGETVKFVSGGNEFAVFFNGVDNDNVNLQRLAPAGTLDHRVTTYITPSVFDVPN